MKAVARDFSMTAAALAGVALLLAPLAGKAAPACAAPKAPPPLPADLVAEAGKLHPYPNFCDIPPTPHDVRAATVWRTDVVRTRQAGARLVQDTAPSTWTLEGTEGFAGEARHEAAPPPPMTSPDDTTEAFVKGAKGRATPPPRPH
jgi:hypothetical protein